MKYKLARCIFVSTDTVKIYIYQTNKDHVTSMTLTFGRLEDILCLTFDLLYDMRDKTHFI